MQTAKPPPVLEAPVLQAGVEMMEYPLAMSEVPPGLETSAEFTTHLCDFCEGPGACMACCIGTFLPCWAHGIIGDVTGEGVGRQPPCVLLCCLYGLGVVYPVGGVCQIGAFTLNVLGRKKMREKYGIPGDCCPGGALPHANRLLRATWNVITWNMECSGGEIQRNNGCVLMLMTQYQLISQPCQLAHGQCSRSLNLFHVWG